MSYITNSFDEQIVSLLKNGAVGLVPSDTIYGLSALALDESAVNRIYELKGRDERQPFPVLLANTEQAEQFGVSLKDLELVQNLWPAPLTIIVSAPNFPEFLHRGLKTLAIRILDNDELRKLLEKTGPLVSTSANLHGEQPTSSVNEAKKVFGDSLDFYVDAGTLHGEPSTIVQAENGKLKVVRQGVYVIGKS